MHLLSHRTGAPFHLAVYIPLNIDRHRWYNYNQLCINVWNFQIGSWWKILLRCFLKIAPGRSRRESSYCNYQIFLPDPFTNLSQASKFVKISLRFQLKSRDEIPGPFNLLKMTKSQIWKHHSTLLNPKLAMVYLFFSHHVSILLKRSSPNVPSGTLNGVSDQPIRRQV